MNGCPYSAKEIVEINELVGRMGILIRQAKAQEHCVQTEYFLELNNDGNRPAFSLIEWLFPKSLLQRRDRCLYARA